MGWGARDFDTRIIQDGILELKDCEDGRVAGYYLWEQRTKKSKTVDDFYLGWCGYEWEIHKMWEECKLHRPKYVVTSYECPIAVILPDHTAVIFDKRYAYWSQTTMSHVNTVKAIILNHYEENYYIERIVRCQQSPLTVLQNWDQALAA